MESQLIDNKSVGERIEGLIAEVRAKSRRSFAISIDADPSFFDKIVKGTASLTDKIANKIEQVYGVSAEWIWTGTGVKHAQGKANAEPSPMQILAVLTDAFKDQAKAMADQAEAFRTQAEIMKSIEGKMAKETTLISLEANYLKRTLAAALTVAKGQEDGMKELRRLLSQEAAQKKIPSGGSGKGKDQIDEGLEKRGKTPA